jgi:hypothetical protein
MKKIYHLTIAYDDETDSVDYVMETVDEEECIVEIGGIDMSLYFDAEVLKLISECYDIGEA